MVVTCSSGELAAPYAVWELRSTILISIDAWVAACWQSYMLWHTI